MKKLFDKIWYVWPRFPGAPFHLTAALLFWTTVAYGFICIIDDDNMERLRQLAINCIPDNLILE